MKKKITLFLSSLMLCLFFITGSSFAQGLLNDEANLLDGSEKTELSAKLEEISDRQGVNVAIVTMDSIDECTPEEFADDYYDEYWLGQDGILLLVNMEYSEWYISTAGYGITAITDAGRGYIADEFVPYLSDSDYITAFTKYAQLCDMFITEAKSGKPFDTGHMPKKPFPLFFIPIGLVAGLGGGFARTQMAKSDLKTVRKQKSAASYERAGSMNLMNSQDIFLYHTVQSVRKEENSGSDTHTSSSGETHGGGGGHF